MLDQTQIPQRTIVLHQLWPAKSMLDQTQIPQRTIVLHQLSRISSSFTQNLQATHRPTKNGVSKIMAL